ncbi:MAG TPA: ABC-F family ATP-binding cassette domain-containing protein [Saprospiraceae bacterium]|nr:ABC-F family ATP-binding cassette domain-containing protein [Saprospiraceae bacterium]
MQYLSLEHVSKSYGEKVLFSDIDLSISKGQKIALIAKNGTGKTTLLRVIAGIDGVEGENASIQISKEIKTAFLMQNPDLDPEATAIDAIFDSKNPALQAIRKYEEALILNDQAQIQKNMLLLDDLKAWDIEAKSKEIMYKLKITNMEQKVGTMSGGQQKRLALARILIDEPDFFILDEPTNHLDLDMIEWLEEYLAKSSLTLFMVTHDRYFLDKVCNEIIELEGGKLYTYRGSYKDYLEKKALRIANDAVNLDKAKKLFSRELEWMRRQPQARGTKAKSRIDDFYELKAEVSGHSQDKAMNIKLLTTRLGSKIVELHNVNKAFGELPIVENLSYKFKKGEKLGIIGANGTGKSSLIKLITEELKPDTGKVIIGETVVFGHYSQEGLIPDNDKMVIDVVRDIAEYLPLEKGLKISAEQLLERFLFPRHQHRVYFSQLSGGEKRRLYLLTILMKNPNFLILDEPTNDLDIPTLNVLEDYLAEYSGCLIIVTHDRYFMDKLVDHLFVLEGGCQIRDYNGNYSDYRAERKQLMKESESAQKPTEIKETKLAYADSKAIKQLERAIQNLEKRKQEINEMFNDASLSIDKITELGSELNKINEEIEAKEMEWLEKMEQ